MVGFGESFADLAEDFGGSFVVVVGVGDACEEFFVALGESFCGELFKLCGLLLFGKLPLLEFLFLIVDEVFLFGGGIEFGVPAVLGEDRDDIVFELRHGGRSSHGLAESIVR